MALLASTLTWKDRKIKNLRGRQQKNGKNLTARHVTIRGPVSRSSDKPVNMALNDLDFFFQVFKPNKVNAHGVRKNLIYLS